MSQPPATLVVEAGCDHHELTLTAAERDLRLSELLRRKHLPLNTRCGQRSLCDGCVVELLRGELRHEPTGATITGNGEPQSLRGCEHQPGPGEIHLRIPARSLLAYEPQVVSEFKVNVPHAHDPLWQQLAIPPAGLAALQRRRPVRLASGVAPDTGRGTEVGNSGVDNPVVENSALENPDVGAASPPRPGGERNRGGDAAPTTETQRPTGSPDSGPHRGRQQSATLEYRADHWLVTALTPERSAPAAPPLGIAVDLGTTTVALVVVNLLTGQVVGGAANFNRQMHLGDDVLTRINLCSTDHAQIRHLQELIVRETVGPLLGEALEQAGATIDQLHCLVAAGNTTMLHLFAGVDPSSLGVAPFTPQFLDHRVLHAGDLPFPAAHARRGFTVHLLAGAAAYVGADLTAGALATGLMYDTGPALLVDVGTNGEIILKHGARLYGCATAAGPAFEGAGLTNGVRATAGAISHIALAADPFTVTNEIIGHKTPIGLCGTAYIDFLSEARRIGLLSPTGRIDRAAVADGDSRIIEWKEYGLALRVAFGQGKTEIVIAETDIASLLQAKAAIAAGILTLLERLQLGPADVNKLYLAGGFGLHLNRAHAIGCGLLPGFVPEQIEVVGNSSLAGAYLALMDCGALDEIAKCGRQMEVIELNLDPGFEDRYIEQLSLP